jgi:Hydrazine synthase alpha subunit middle domain
MFIRRYYGVIGLVVAVSCSALLACSGQVHGGDHGDAAVDSPVDPPFHGTVGTILFVTQVPVSNIGTVTAPFGNHDGSLAAAPRGGDLMIRYPDGTLRNLTREAGFGTTGMQGAGAIAVREPSVHWSGNKAIFSMVIGAPKAFEQKQFRWQMYEVTGLAQGETVAITKVANQPADYDNVSPIYGSDDRIIFASDRPRSGQKHLFPQLDEYESTPSTSGLWSLDPTTGDLTLLNHTPSGAFSPSVDSFGRVVFTKWDHLQRDQQADAERTSPGRYGTITYADESDTAARSADLTGAEVYPEPRTETDPDYKPNTPAHRFNQFFPWEINQDGTAEETLNHVGRHELTGSYIEGSFADDPNLTADLDNRTHKNRYAVGGDGGMFQMREDPTSPGTYYATLAHEFGTGAGGALFKFAGGPAVNPEDFELIAVTDRDSAIIADAPGQAPNSTGHYRDPLPMTDGTLIAVHTADVGSAKNEGTRAAPAWNYHYRLVAMKKDGALSKAAGTLTAGIDADVSYYDPDVLVTYKGPLWELDPVEVAPRTRPAARVETIADPELTIFHDTGVDVAKLRAWLKANDLALITSRNVTARDRADKQQPFNLRVPGGAMTTGAGGKIYDIAFLQVFEGDSLRGYGGVDHPAPGRRLLARPMHGAAISSAAGGPTGSVALGLDGSMAAFVPARRALSWQLTDPNGVPVVRERNWVSFQAGEIRACPVCHGVNTVDQAGRPVATNPPEALRTLMHDWAAAHP